MQTLQKKEATAADLCLKILSGTGAGDLHTAITVLTSLY